MIAAVTFFDLILTSFNVFGRSNPDTPSLLIKSHMSILSNELSYDIHPMAE